MAEGTVYRASDVEREVSMLREQGHASAATLLEELHKALDKVTFSSWRYLVWNDHNFTEQQRMQWREEAKMACRDAEHFLMK